MHATARAAYVATLATVIACRTPSPSVRIVGETAIREGDPVPATSPWFDGTTVTLAAARGETLGIQVLHGDGPAVLAIPDARVTGFGVQTVRVRHGSTALYGTGLRGAGVYPDELIPGEPPSYFDIAVPRDAEPGMHHGVLFADGQLFRVDLAVARATLPPLPIGAWAEYDPRSLDSSLVLPTAGDRACVAMFRERGVLLAPAMPLAAWPARASMLGDSPIVPVRLDDPDEVPAWIAATRGTGKLPFAIPIDEPHGDAARNRVRALATRVRAEGGGPNSFAFAVTDEPRADYGDLIDRYVTLKPRRGDWSYNGAPPSAGSMVVDGAPPGPRTWGWLEWRYGIPFWYAWQAMYWQDKYNHRSLPPRPLDAHADARSFDDGEDHGNLDGVLALPGCHPTLRLEELRRGLEDRALLELAATCEPGAAADVAASIVPRALTEAAPGEPSWPRDEASWELARRKLLDLASCALR
jgi:hypothetical protein